MRRRGFTLIEVMVAVAIAGVLIVVLAGLQHLWARSFGRSHERLTLVQVGNLALECMGRDLANIYEDDAHRLFVDEHEMSFYVLDRKNSVVGAAADVSLTISQVRYRFDPDTQRIFRVQGDGRERPLRGEFVSLDIARTLRKDHPLGKGLTFPGCVEIKLTCASPRTREAQEDHHVLQKHDLTMIASFPVQTANKGMLAELWNPNG